MLLKLSKFFVYLSVFSIVVVLTGIFFPFIGGKCYFFRVSVELALACLLLWWAFESRTNELEMRIREFFRQPLVLAVSAFVLAFMLATIFAYDATAAFWSNFERGEGGFQMLHYYAFFVLLGLLFRSERDWRRIFTVSLVAAGLMIAYGIGAAVLTKTVDATGAARYEPAFGFIGPYIEQTTGKPIDMATDPKTGVLFGPGEGPTTSTFFGRFFHPSARFQGSLGNPAYVAPYLIFAFFYVLYLWFTAHRRSLALSVFYGALLALFLLFFILSQTRGAFLGLGVGVAIFLLYFVFSRRGLRWWGVGTIVVLAIVGGTLYLHRNDPAIKQLPGSRLLEINFMEQTAQTRFWTWGSAWQGFLDRPVLGWGPENFSSAFDKHFDPRHFVPNQNTETWFDRAHSVVFDYLAETGALGFLAYLSIFAVLYWQLLRRRVRTPGEPSREQRTESLVRVLFVAVVSSYLVQGLVLFDVLPIYMNLFMLIASAAYWLEHRTPAVRQAGRAAAATR
jgi:hypothetical protein